MTLAVQPLVKTSYTERGNEYKESNIGKCVSGAAVAGTAAYLGGKFAYNKAKKLYPKAEALIIDISNRVKNTKMDDIKNMAKNAKESIPDKQTVKAFIKKIPQYLTSVFEAIKNFTIASIEFVKTNAKKINKENLKNAGQAIVEFAKKPAVKDGAVVAGIMTGILALGYATDAAANKINARKADKI